MKSAAITLAIVFNFQSAIAQNANAGKSDKALAEAVKIYEYRIQQLAIKVTDEHKSRQPIIDMIEKRVAKTRADLEFCKTNHPNDPKCGGQLGPMGQTVKMAQDQLATDQKNLDAQHAAIKAEEKKYYAELAGRQDVLSEQDRRRVAATNERRAEIRQVVNEAQVDNLKLQFKVQDLGRDIDHGALGSYVAAKMGLMLNSQAFCQSQARCNEPKGQAKNRVTPNEMKEIFPGMSNIFSDNNIDFWQINQQTRQDNLRSSGGTR